MEVSELQTGPGLIQPHLFGLSLQYMSLQYTWAAYSTPGFPTAHLVSYNRPAVPPTGASTVASHPWLAGAGHGHQLLSTNDSFGPKYLGL